MATWLPLVWTALEAGTTQTAPDDRNPSISFTGDSLNAAAPATAPAAAALTTTVAPGEEGTAPMTTAAAQLALAPPTAAMAVARCLVFAELWSRGYWISPGYRFGVDFLVYEGNANL